MSEAAKTLMQAVLELPEKERLRIADAVYESLTEDDPALDAVLAERTADHESGKAPGVPADEFIRRLRAERAARR
jgi:putative addiction module component (TIGR02574 family)